MKNRPQNKRRKWLYLGASSTWSFGIRVASMIQNHLGESSLDRSYQFSLDGDAHKVYWNRVHTEQQPDLSRLPSQDYAIYLINAVKYHLGGIFHVFDEENFMPKFNAFYERDANDTDIDRLWYTQYLLLLAFGKSLLHPNKASGVPPGTEFFTRAMSVIPEASQMHEEPILACEVLTLVTLYFYCLDMRQTAYSWIGQALRVALVEGLHTDLPSAQIGERFAVRCNNVWWTIYILDRMLSATIGVPTSVRDSDITNLLPSPTKSPTKLATLSLHVKLSRLISFILMELYSATGSLESSYLTKTRGVLRHMAVIAQEMEQVIDIKFKTTLDTITRVATHLRLLYHQCVILAIRPLLLCLLQETLKHIDRPGSQPNIPNVPNVPNTVQDLVQTCANSAIKTLKITNTLRGRDMLDYFLPFDLENICAATSVLIVIGDILKCINIPKSIRNLHSQILGDFISSGNAVARLRQTELHDLERLAMKLWQPSTGEAVATGQSSEQTAVDSPLCLQPGQTLLGRAIGSISVGSNMGPPVLPPQNHSTGQQAAQTTQVLDSSERRDIFLANDANENELDGFSRSQSVVAFQDLLRDSPFPTTSPTSSQDFAHTFDLAREEMLVVADQIDINAFDGGLDLDFNGDYCWFLNDNVGSLA